MQYVQCKFRENDSRSYTYHNEGAPVAAGDVVRIKDREGLGWQKVFVVGVTFDAPKFATKPIIGIHIEDDELKADS